MKEQTDTELMNTIHEKVTKAMQDISDKRKTAGIFMGISSSGNGEPTIDFHLTKACHAHHIEIMLVRLAKEDKGVPQAIRNALNTITSIN